MADYSANTSKTFHRFPYLPSELRALVWGHYAVAPKPLLHVFEVGPDRRAILRRVPTDYHGGGPKMAKQIRSIMQVNHEARINVLKGREMIFCHMYKSFYLCNGTPGGSWTLRNSYFFVDWTVDMIYLRWSRLDDKIHLPTFQELLWPKVKNMAVQVVRRPYLFGVVRPGQLCENIRIVLRLGDNERLSQLQRITCTVNNYCRREVSEVVHYGQNANIGSKCPAITKSYLHPINVGAHDCYCIREIKSRIDQARTYRKDLTPWDTFIHSSQNTVASELPSVMGRPIAVDMALIHPLL